MNKNRNEEEINNTNTPENQENTNNINPEGEVNEEATNENETTENAEGETEETDRVAELEAELAASKDKYLRLTAEYDNYRRRTLKEKMELTKSAGESILVNVLPVVDDFDRALQHFDDSVDLASAKEGMELIYNKFQDFITKNGIKEIEAQGAEFDTDIHEALTKIPAPSEDMKGKVVDVITKGYMLGDKVIRFAKVVVGD